MEKQENRRNWLKEGFNILISKTPGKTLKNLEFFLCRFRKACYICTRIQQIADEALKEKWQSGRMRQS